MMEKTFLLRVLSTPCVALAMGLITGVVHAQPSVQTQVFIRHAEKLPNGLGQLDCQGLNRALALPARFKTLFGVPDAVFAPDPADTKKDHGIKYSYVRPLATVEPLAIAFGLPINATIGWSDTHTLRQTLKASGLRNSLVLIAWEHKEIEKMLRATLKAYGADPEMVPHWKSDDFDSIYILRISEVDGQTQVVFSQEQQGLNGLSTQCPGLP